MSVRTCLFLSSTATLSDPCQARFVAPTKSALFFWQEVRRFNTPSMLCTTMIFVCTLSLWLDLCASPSGLCFLSLPIRSWSISKECVSLAAGIQESERQCAQKVKVDHRFRPGLVKDGECIRFPWPHPAMSHFSLHVSLTQLQRAWRVHAEECHTWPYHIKVCFKVIFRTENWHSNDLMPASATSWSLGSF